MSINDDVRIIMGESSVQFSSYTMSDSSLVRHCSMLHFRCTLLKSKPTEAPQEKKKKPSTTALFSEAQTRLFLSDLQFGCFLSTTVLL